MNDRLIQPAKEDGWTIQNLYKFVGKAWNHSKLGKFWVFLAVYDIVWLMINLVLLMSGDTFAIFGTCIFVACLAIAIWYLRYLVNDPWQKNRS